MQPVGYFRAEPLDCGFHAKMTSCVKYTGKCQIVLRMPELILSFSKNNHAYGKDYSFW
jgi:hypothetical protein